MLTDRPGNRTLVAFRTAAPAAIHAQRPQRALQHPLRLRGVAITTLLAVGALLSPSLLADEPDVVWPSPHWKHCQPQDVGLDAATLEQAKRYALSAGGSGMIIRHGCVVTQWGNQRQRYDIKSATKSFGATMLGVAISDGLVQLKTPAGDCHPQFGMSADKKAPEPLGQQHWLKQITLLHLATHTSGFAKPGGYERLLFEPGSHWHYSDGGPNWLAECLTLLYHRDLQDVMFERVFTPLGITRDDLQWRNNQYRDRKLDGVPRREFGAGIHANVDALSRLGYLYLHNGVWKGQQILSADFVELATHPVSEIVGIPEWEPKTHGNASDHYGLLWWNNADGTLTSVPEDAFWAWGLYDSLIVVIPSLDLVIVRCGENGKQWPRKNSQNHYDVLGPFVRPIVAAVETPSPGHPEQTDSGQASIVRRAPYPGSRVVTGIQWSPAATVVRRAEGSDNWPITWADDDRLYTAYGDGWGFTPRVEKKLSLGLASISGDPADLQGTNIRAASAEQTGQGPDGLKASGMLMVDGVLYMLVRNADNSQLAWSVDHGRQWQWADWKFRVSFGAATFLNYGRNYAGARDGFVYVVSHDSDSAYSPADDMVLARVPKDLIRVRTEWEFFAGLNVDGQPAWSSNVAARASVFHHAGKCYRSGITYNAGLNRYLWCQVLPDSSHPQGTRFEGGFGIYEAPEPWGPWSTVFFTEHWDIGPGETSCFPTKWMSADGRALHLLFSGDDCFSVRKAVLSVR
jgi:CubicO group peptidase (beta-lactamase class C family)